VDILVSVVCLIILAIISSHALIGSVSVTIIAVIKPKYQYYYRPISLIHI